MSTTILNPLRADIESLLVAAALESESSGDKYATYETFKAMLSRRCGWDAPPADFDQSQYDRAMSKYIELARI